MIALDRLHVRTVVRTLSCYHYCYETKFWKQSYKVLTLNFDLDLSKVNSVIFGADALTFVKNFTKIGLELSEKLQQTIANKHARLQYPLAEVIKYISVSDLVSGWCPIYEILHSFPVSFIITARCYADRHCRGKLSVRSSVCP